MDNHIDPEALAAFADGTLPEEEYDRMIEHMAGCELCTLALGNLIKTLRETRKLRLVRKDGAEVPDPLEVDQRIRRGMTPPKDEEK